MDLEQDNGDPTGASASPSVNYNRSRRRSSIFPQYLRRKSKRKDSTFASESTTNLWPFAVEEKQPSLFDYQPGGGQEGKANLGLKFGWVNGVYIRTVLNIWGVMLFLRMGWITGHAGIVASLVIVLVSTLVTVCTTLSMSAICTNGEVGTGGIYYMISRSLGAEAGAMIGVIFSFANAVLVSLNLVGAAETTVEIIALFGHKPLIDPTNDARIYGAILLVLVAIIPLIGMDWEAKAMFVLMMILLVGILNYLVGTFLPLSEKKIAEGMLGWSPKVIGANLWPKFGEVGFAEVFAVFFPSVIGIFAGASMSGDLRNPNEAIPKGTFLAILTTSSTYGLLIIFLGFTVLPYASGSYEEMSNLTDALEVSCRANRSCKFGLTNDYQTMAMSSAFSPLIYAGIYAATISSALGSYVCSPRIFQALCEDKLFPYIHYFAKGYGKGNDPRRGYVLTFIIALVFISIGELNLIAPIISNFFMACFCLVNIACFHSSFVGSPSFRPTFKYYNQWVSLLTGLACVGIMFFLDWISAVVTVLIMGVLYLYISKKRPDVNWGSSTRSHVYNNALSSALKLNFGKDHIKNFRPSILLLTGNPSARIPLVEFANNITRNRSLLMIGHITNYEIVQEIRERVINAQYEWMLKRKIKAFYLLLEASSLASGVKTMLQVSGLGRKLAPSIIMLGYKSSWRDCLVEDLLDYYSVMLKAMDMSTGICILRVQEGLDYADFFGPVFRSRDAEADTFHDELPEPVSPSNHTLRNHSPQPSPSPTGTATANSAAAQASSPPSQLLAPTIEEPPEEELELEVDSKASTPNVGSPKVRFDRVVSFNVTDENNNNNNTNHHNNVSNGGVLLSPTDAAVSAAVAQTPSLLSPPSTPALHSALASSPLSRRPPPPLMFTFTNTSHLPKAVDRKMENMKALIPHDALEAINQFNDKQKEGPIDIWWLSEDGGLTILLPYMLKNSTYWSHCAIRVFCLAKTEDQIEGIRSNMTELLDRLRIPYADVLVYSQAELEPSDHTVGRFRHFIGSFLSKSEAVAGRSAKLSKSDLAKFEAMTSRYMKIRDLLLTHSRLSTLIVMTLPKPHKDIPASLFMSWLETITEDMPPFLFVRGHKHVPSIAI